MTVDSRGQAIATKTYANGYTPQDLVSAYKLPALPIAGSNFRWNGQTVAIVDAHDNPNAATDLMQYRKQFKMPLCASSKPSPSPADLTDCFFNKVNQAGQTGPLPTPDSGWAEEIDLDIEMASAACPECKILLVEASSTSMPNLAAAVDRAATMRADAISNSYGGGESSSSTVYDSHFNNPGIAITASAGDDGYGVEFPASSPYVTAVGGTSLSKSGSSRGWTEKAWADGSSGCSAVFTKPSWQPKLAGCSHRVVADVSAVADPNTGVAVFDSYHANGWSALGGTSASAPIIAGIYALAGNTGATDSAIRYGEYPYSHTSHLFDITSGSNGNCGGLALCTAMPGFDGPTGLGSPNGLLAF